MSNNNVEQQTFTVNDEIFVNGTYNGISVIIRQKDGFINATVMCKQFNKRFRKIFENHAWQLYFEEFKHEYYVRPGMGEPIYELKKGYSNDLRGTFVDPQLINYIAIWASPKYAVTVGKIMDSVDKQVHEVLKQKELKDTVENAEPIFNEVVEEITTMNLLSKAWDKCNERGDFSDYEKMRYITSDKMY